MSHDDFESVPGLPGPLPAGEKLLWQGTPQWTALARRCFRVPLASGYLLAMVVIRALVLWQEGQPPRAVAIATLSSALLSLIAISVLLALAWLSANATIYTLTNRRIAIRHGISVGLTLNVPFSSIEAAALKEFTDGSGQISLRLQKAARIGYLLNWPHVRPGMYSRPEPMLRGLSNVKGVGEIIAAALAASVQVAAPDETTRPRAPSKAVRLPTTVAA